MKLLFKNIKNILWLYKPYWRYGKFFVFLSLLFWLLIVPAAQLIRVHLPNAIIEGLTNNTPFNQIVILIIVAQVLLMFQPVYENIFNMFCKNRILPKIDAKLKRDIYERAIKTDYKYIDSPEYYDNYTFALNHYAGRASDAQNLVNRMSSSLITIVAMLAIIATLSPIAILVTILGGIIENAMHIRTNYFDVKKDSEIVPFNRRLGYHHRVFYQSQYAADLKSTNIKDYIFKEYDENLDKKLSVIKKYAYKMIGWAITGNITFYIARTFIIINIAHGIYSGNILSVGLFMTMILAVERLTDAMNALFYQVKDANRLGLYADRIRSFFAIESSIEVDSVEKLTISDGLFSVEFKDVCFQYENTEFAFENFNFSINAGEKVAIVGENGVGKSTIVKLLLRFYDISSGAILINGIDIREYDVNILRRRIGVAFQQSNIYALPFERNIDLYNKLDENKRNDIFQKFNFNKILEKNNADYYTELTREFDENGIMLSGGEVQKIGIARLMAGNFGLLILDEASSALDPIAEYEINNLILDSSNRATTIMIAHRLSTIRNADRILLVESGAISEAGKHDELMALKGKYYEMFTKQAENYIK